MIKVIKRAFFQFVPRTWQRAFLVHRLLAKNLGFLRSVREMRPLNGEGQPIPWFSYPATAYLESLDLSGARVLEYGSGNSTLFWARVAKEVVAVENDCNWHREISLQCPANATIVLAEEQAQYVEYPIPKGSKFDIIVVDGKWRDECSVVAPECLSEGGMVILDNAEWYNDAAEGLQAKGFHQVDFRGFIPINGYLGTTAVFLKPLVRFVRQKGHQASP